MSLCDCCGEHVDYEDEKYVCPACWKVADFTQEAKSLRADLESCQKERNALKQQLERAKPYLEHISGCRLAFGEPCSCGLNTVIQALQGQEEQS